MTTVIVSTSSSGSGLQVNLGLFNSIWVLENAFLGSTDNIAISGTGGHFVSISGTVYGENGGISLGNGDDGNHKVLIAETGRVESRTAAVTIYGIGSLMVNEGTILAGGYGIYCTGHNDFYEHSILKNYGTITSADNAAVARGGVEDFLFRNFGVIRALDDDVAFSSTSATGASTVINTGSVLGDVEFGPANDRYDGTLGRIVGTVQGNLGNDVLKGGRFADRLEGGTGRDTLTGGRAADVFLYLSVADSTTAASQRDLITDFSHAERDRISLAGIDADANTVRNDAFRFIGGAAFSGDAGQLRLVHNGGKTVILADTDGDRDADLSINLAGTLNLVAGDFLL